MTLREEIQKDKVMFEVEEQLLQKRLDECFERLKKKSYEADNCFCPMPENERKQIVVRLSDVKEELL